LINEKYKVLEIQPMSTFFTGKEYQPFYEVPKPTAGNRFVITDIHGFYDTFLGLIAQIKLSKNDQLFILGDIIDRGKKGKELFDWILHHLKEGYNIFPLRGNHEEMMWNSHLQDYDEETLRIPGYKWGRGIIDEKRNILPQFVELVKKMPYFYILDKFYLVHAGFDYSKQNPFTDYKSMVWIKDFIVNERLLKGKTLIHGHSKRSIYKINKSITKRECVIGLDNATYKTKNSKYGNLVCLNLDTYELFIQPNIDKKHQ